MEAVCYSKMLVPTYQIAQYHNPEVHITEQLYFALLFMLICFNDGLTWNKVTTEHNLVSL